MVVWYLLAIQLFEAVDFPFVLPVGDLSGLIKGRQERIVQQGKQEEVKGEKAQTPPFSS